MEALLYIIIAVLLALGPAVGFFLGLKCAAALLGIDLHPGDTMQVLDWDEMPEVYKPRHADDAPAADQAAQEGPEDGLQGEGLPTGKVKAETAVDALVAAMEAARVPLGQLVDTMMDATKDDLEAFVAIIEAEKGAPVELESTGTVEITLEPEEPAADEAAALAAPADSGEV